MPLGHPRIYLNASNLARLRTHVAAGTAPASRFIRTVDVGIDAGSVYLFDPWHAALASQITGIGSDCDWAVQTEDAYVASEEARIGAGLAPLVAGDSYLEVGGHVGSLSLVYDWCFDKVSATQRQRWIAFANQAVWNVWNPTTATWGGKSTPWSGWSVDNPVNNYYFSFLRGTMLLGLATRGENAQADGWISQFRTVKLQNQLVPTYRSDLVGGGSREGTGYGVAMRELFRLYDLWEATTGERVADATDHARSSLAWMIHATVPTLDRIAPIGDHARDSTAALFDYHRDYLQVLTALYPSDPWARVAEDFLATCSVPQMSQGFMTYSDFLYENAAATRKPLSDVYPTYRATGTGYVFSRSGWTPDATWIEFSAGPYTESHAHRDQGQWLLYKREWLAYDGNIDSNSGILQQEEVHNLVALSRAGAPIRMPWGAGPAGLKALRDDAVLTHLAGDLAPAYPAAAGVTQDQREVVFLKPNVIVIFDRVTGDAGQAALTKRWQLNTPLSPVVSPTGTRLSGTQTKLEVYPVLPPQAPVVTPLSTIDPDIKAGNQLSWTQSSSGTDFFLMVLSLDNEVSAVASADVVGQRGVTLTLTGARSATVRFNEAAWGGSVALSGGGAPPLTVTLDATVAVLPAFSVP